MGDNWVHKYNNLKKLHKLVTRYIEEKLGQSLSELDPPNLNAIAKGGDPIEVLKLCELVIAIAVQCERNQYYIHKIQSLPHASQHALMLSLEQVKDLQSIRSAIVFVLFVTRLHGTFALVLSNLFRSWQPSTVDRGLPRNPRCKETKQGLLFIYFFLLSLVQAHPSILTTHACSL